MKTHFFRTQIIFIISISLAFALSLPCVFAQARRAGTAVRARVPLKDNAAIKKIEGIGHAGRVRTPEYRTSVTKAKARTHRWARISVHYDTKAEWTDELEFRYYVLVRQSKTKLYTLYTATAAYIDIPKGRHLSTVFLRPNTVERYGEVERAAVEIFQNGAKVAIDSNPKSAAAWWLRLPGTVRTESGVLLNRSQTPFAFVACDNYETIKPK